MKRTKLEIIKDILNVIRENNNSIKITPLIRRSNLSTYNFTIYFNDLIKKRLIVEKLEKNGKFISLNENGFKYLEKYKNIMEFIEEFDL